MGGTPHHSQNSHQKRRAVGRVIRFDEEDNAYVERDISLLDNPLLSSNDGDHVDGRAFRPEATLLVGENPSSSHFALRRRETTLTSTLTACGTRETPRQLLHFVMPLFLCSIMMVTSFHSCSTYSVRHHNRGDSSGAQPATHPGRLAFRSPYIVPPFFSFAKSTYPSCSYMGCVGRSSMTET